MNMRPICLALTGALLIPLAACEPGDLLEVKDPDVVSPGGFQDETALPAVHAAAIGDFAVSYAGDPDQGDAGQVLMSGLVTDEFYHTGTFDTRESLDRRLLSETNPHVESTFRALHRARVSAERAANLFAEFAPDDEDHAEVLNLAGFTYVMFGENYCSGVPFSRVADDGSLEFGEPETTTQVFTRAVDRFDAALAVAGEAGSDAQQNLARVGRARALIGRGDYESAAEAVALVPTDFEYVMFHSESSPRQNNGVWSFNNNAGRWSIPDREGVNGLPYRSAGDIDGAVLDTRIPTEQIGNAQRTSLQGRGEHWAQLKYPERASSTTLASGIEARLIQAESALRNGAGGVSEFISLHNQIRGEFGLPPLDEVEVAAMTQREREDLHFRERAYGLWLTSHRLGDLRRLMWDYGRQQSEIFPVGTHHRAGAAYGDDTNIPIPFDEQNNPNAVGCMVRDDHQGRPS